MQSPRVRTAAYLCLAAGVLGALSGVVLSLVEPAVPGWRFSFPLTASAFTAVQVWFGIHHLGLVAGLLGVRWAGVLPEGRAARWGWAVALVGMVLLTLTEWFAVAAASAATDSGIGGAVGAAYGLATTLLGFGLLSAGIAVWRSGPWADAGWRRGVLLALGVWVFVPLFPALIVSPADGARLAIGGWMVLFAALGAALLSPARRAVALPA